MKINKIKFEEIETKLKILSCQEDRQTDLKKTSTKILPHQSSRIIILFCRIGPNSNFRNSISSNQSRKSRDSDLLNKLAKDKSKSSSKPRDRNNSSMNLETSLNMTSKSNSAMSEEQSIGNNMQIEKKQSFVKQPPKIHNCVCFVAEQCLSYNCNCFLSPLPCTPQCCPNCINLKSSLPLKISNSCNCKKTKCLKLYCQCLSKGLYCTIMCRCQLCQNHQHSHKRKDLQGNANRQDDKGCNCKKTGCEKKYCECYSQKRKCTKACKCTNCNNFMPIIQSNPKPMILEKKNTQIFVPTMEFEEPDFNMQPKKKKR